MSDGPRGRSGASKRIGSLFSTSVLLLALWLAACAQSVEAPASDASSLAEARQHLQEISARMVGLVEARPVTNAYFGAPDPEERLAQGRIDAVLAALDAVRSDALLRVVLAENPAARLQDPVRRILQVPSVGSGGEPRWVAGGLLPVWHVRALSPSVFAYAEAIASHPEKARLPADTAMTTRLLLAGTTSENGVHPYPGDIDFAEEVILLAPTPEAAGAALAASIVESVGRVGSHRHVEFNHLRIMPLEATTEAGVDAVWRSDRILDPAQRVELARQLARVGGGRLNSEWRGLEPGQRFVVLGKIFGVHVLESVGREPIMKTQPLGVGYQQLYIGQDVPPPVEVQTLGDFASSMRSLALREGRRQDYLKAAKRAFNYFRTTGDLAAMAELEPLFESSAARVYQQVKLLEAVAGALEPATLSRILPAAVARSQLQGASEVIREELPSLGAPRDRADRVASELGTIATALRRRSAYGVTEGLLAGDARLSARLRALTRDELRPAVQASLEGPVREILRRRLDD